MFGKKLECFRKQIEGFDADAKPSGDDLHEAMKIGGRGVSRALPQVLIQRFPEDERCSIKIGLQWPFWIFSTEVK